MNNQIPRKPRKWRQPQLGLVLVGVFLVGVVSLVWYRPEIFHFHANVSSVSGKVSGEVFKSSSGGFLIRLNSGAQLTVQMNPPRAFLLPRSSPSGFCIGNYLVIPSASVGGVDLSKNEGFNKQLPTIGKGTITLKDPAQRDGEFSFPIGGRQGL